MSSAAPVPSFRSRRDRPLRRPFGRIGRKRWLLTQLHDLESLLVPGPWLLRSHNVAHHLGHPSLPRHFRDTMLGSRLGMTRSAAFARAVSGVAVPPNVGWVHQAAVAAPPEELDGDHVALGVARNADLILIASDHGSLLRIRFEGTLSQPVLDLRAQMTHYLAAPRLEVVEDGAVSREELVDGDLLRAMSPEARKRILRRLLTDYGELTSGLAAGDSGALVAAAMVAVDRLPASSGCRGVVDSARPGLQEASARWPLVPSHGDLHADNLVVRRGRPVLIDFEHAGHMPFFYDIFSLAMREADFRRDDLLRALLSTEFEPELRALFASAGCSYDPKDASLCAMAVMLLHGHTRADHGAWFDDEGFARRLRARLGLLSELG